MNSSEEELICLRQEIANLRSSLADAHAAFHMSQELLYKHQIESGLLPPDRGTAIEPDRSLPSILIVAVPKSAGTYVTQSLMRGLKLERRWLSVNYFPAPDLFRTWDLDKILARWRLHRPLPHRLLDYEYRIPAANKPETDCTCPRSASVHDFACLLRSHAVAKGPDRSAPL